jgi:hypothetical protein
MKKYNPYSIVEVVYYEVNVKKDFIVKLTAQLKLHKNQLDILQTVKSEFVNSQNRCEYGSTEQFGYHYTLCPDEAKRMFNNKR